MTKRLRVAVLGGGRSSEHDVSLRSAASVAAGLDPDRFDVTLITISRAGLWLDAAGEPVAVTPGAGGPLGCDVVFPALHGPFGEDGTVQGLLEILGVPYVGSGVLGSALTMDKERCKSVLRDAGIDVAHEVVVHRHQSRADMHEQIAALGYPAFVKPARLGSSVGISRVETAAEIDAALDLAFSHDEKVLVEELLVGDELECSVLGLPPNLTISEVGRLGFHNEWYDYDAKYSEGGSWLEVPAVLPPETSERLRSTAAHAFTLCDCHGMARVDFFHTHEGRLVLNEINTIPGFTATSYYARMFEASGIVYGDLLTRLIELALERFAAESSLLR